MQRVPSDAKPGAIEPQSVLPAHGNQNASKCAISQSSKHHTLHSSAAEQTEVVNGSSHLLPASEPPSLGIKSPEDIVDSAVQDLKGSSLEPNNSVDASAHDRSDVSIVA